MDFDASTYRRDVAIAASGDPQRPAQEGKAVQYLQDHLPALRPADTPWSVADADAPLFCTLLVNATQQSNLTTFGALEDYGAARQKVQAISAAQIRGVVEATGAFVPSFLEPKVSQVKRKKGHVEMPIALGRDQRAPASAVFDRTLVDVPPIVELVVLIPAGAVVYIAVSALLEWQFDWGVEEIVRTVAKGMK